MKEKWKVSVLTPVHHTPIELLERAFDSLKKQSFAFSEIQWVVVLHNCRPDYVRSIKELLGEHPNISLSEASREETGVSFARNATLDRAEGEYLFFLDSDDEMQPECIETVLCQMEESRADTAIYTARVFGGGMTAYYTDADPALGTQVFKRGDRRISKSMCISGMPLWTRCYKRAFVAREGVRFDESLDFGEDFMFNISLTGRAGRVCVLPQLTGYTYYAGIGMTGSILAVAKDTTNRAPGTWENDGATLWENEETALFLRSVWRAGRKYGLHLDTVMWVLLSQFGRLILFSDLPQRLKDNFLETLRPLTDKLQPPVMEWKEKQAELDNCCAFVRAITGMPHLKPDTAAVGQRPVIFVFVNPAWGHVTPLLSVIRALVGKGFHVRVYSGEDQASRIRKTGAVYVSCDDIYEEIDLSERKALGLFRWIEYARRMDSLIGREIKNWSPLLALVDASTIWGRLLAEKYGIPIIFSSATMIMCYRTYSYWRPLIEELGPHMEEINGKLEELREAGFPGKDLVGLYLVRESDPCITYTSRMIQPKAELFQETNTFFTGCSRYLEPVKDKTADKKRPLVYVTLGTVSSINVWFFRSCMIAFRDMDVDVVMVIWKNVSITQLGEIPPNVTIEISVKQEEILRKADVAVFHAGLNTMSDCLMLGVPMVAYPSFGEQYGNARRIRELDLGIVIDNYRPDTIRQAVRSVLADERYRNHACAVGEDMRRYKGAEGAADWICGWLQQRMTNAGGKVLMHAGPQLLERSELSYIYSRRKPADPNPLKPDGAADEQLQATQSSGYEIVPIYIEVVLPHNVNMTALQGAVDDTVRAFPLSRHAVVEMNGGFYLAERKERILVEPVSLLPEKAGSRPSRCRNLLVYSEGKTILVITDHGQMDARGLVTMTEYLMNHYTLRREGAASAGLLLAEDKGSSRHEIASQSKDPMKISLDSEWNPLPEMNGHPWHIPFEGDVMNGLTELRTDTEPVLSLCKKMQTSPGILFAVLIGEALSRLYPQSRKADVTAALPVDCRDVLGCRHTLKNCSFPVYLNLNRAELVDAPLEERARILRENLKEQSSASHAKGWIRYYQALARFASGNAGKADWNVRREKKAEGALPYTFLLSYLRICSQTGWEGAEWFYDFISSPESFTMLEYGGCFRLWITKMKPGDADRTLEQALEEVFAALGLSVRLSERKRRSLHFTIPSVTMAEIKGGALYGFPASPEQA